MEIEAFSTREKIALIDALQAREVMLLSVLHSAGQDVSRREINKLIQDVYNVREKLGLL